MIISLIAALSDNGVIGKNNTLPWHYPEDLKYFKKMTLGKPIIMGRKTFESMKSKPLPDRQNIILTQEKNFQAQGCTIVHSKEEAIASCQMKDEIMIIGGEKIFKLFLNDATRLYLTFIHQTIDGDTFFPDINWQEWNKIKEDAQGILSFVIFERK